MKPLALAFALLTATLLSGCGASLTTITPVTPSAPASLAGNWQMQIQDIAAPANPTISYLLLGALSVKGPTVSGTFRILPALLPSLASPCVQPLTIIPFTGTVDASSLLTLTSTPFSGSVVTMRLQLPLLNNIARGTTQIVGGACATPSLPLIGVYVPSVTGTYAGTLTPVQLGSFPIVSTTPLPVTVTLVQAPANADGQFPVTASLTFNPMSCASISVPVTGFISGLSLKLTGPPTGTLAIPSATFYGASISYPGFPYLDSLLSISGSSASCAGGLYNGNLVRQ